MEIQIYVKSTLNYFWKFEGLESELDLSIKSVERCGDYKTSKSIYDFNIILRVPDYMNLFLNSENIKEKYCLKSKIDNTLIDFVKDYKNYLKQHIRTTKNKGVSK